MLFPHIPRMGYRVRSFGGVDIFEQDGSYLFASWYIGLLQVIGSKRKKEHLGVRIGAWFRLRHVKKGKSNWWLSVPGRVCIAIVLALVVLVTQRSVMMIIQL